MISKLRAAFSFPLLAKELAERAARPRTYWLRVGLAILLYGGFWYAFGNVVKKGAIETIAVLGAGQQIFEAAVGFLFSGLAAFVPALLCGVITQEKERDSLVLLLLTRMRPWQIVLQKYVGGLIPALTIVFLSMPLVAVAYAYGGVTDGQVALALVVLILAILQLGAIAIWASCWCRTTVAAFLTTYFVAGAVYGLPILLLEIGEEFDFHPIKEEWIALVHFPPTVFSGAMKSWGGTFDWKRFGTSCGAITVVTVIFLLAAIREFPRRAVIRPTNYFRRIFAVMDRWVHRVNETFGGITFGRKAEDLPGAWPIVWREKRARSLARPEYLVRLLVVILIPVVLISSLFGGETGKQEELSIIIAVLAGLALLGVTTTAANCIVDERVNQTFQVLLTTPMTAADILRQKARALRPFLVMLSIPILVVSAIEFAAEFHSGGDAWRTPKYSDWVYPAGILSTAAIYFPLFCWFAIWMGLWCKTRLRAIITTLIFLALWLGGPIFVLEELNWDRPGTRYAFLLSPAVVPALNESTDLDDIDPAVPWMPLFINAALYGGILFLIRRHCLKKADWYLRR